MEMKMKHISWSEKEDLTLVPLYNEGLSFYEIVSALNREQPELRNHRNVAQCSSRLNRIKMWMRKHFIRTSLSKKGNRELIPLSALVNMHLKINENLPQIKRPEKTNRNWTEEQTNILVEMYNAGQSFKEIVKSFSKHFPETKWTVDKCRSHLRAIRTKIEPKGNKPQHNDRRRRLIPIEQNTPKLPDVKKISQKTMAEKMILVMGVQKMSPKEVERALIVRGEIDRYPSKRTRAYISYIFSSAKNEGYKLFQRVKRGLFRVSPPIIHLDPIKEVDVVKIASTSIPKALTPNHSVLTDQGFKKIEELVEEKTLRSPFEAKYHQTNGSVTVLLDGNFNCKELQDKAKKLISEVVIFNLPK